MIENSLTDIDQNTTIELSEQSHGSLNHFLSNLFDQPLPKFASFSFTLNAIDPLAYLEMCWNSDAFQYYWEKPTDEFAIAAGGETCHISAKGKERFNSISTKIDTLKNSTAEYSSVPHPYSGLMLLGGFSFFDTKSDQLWNNFHPASFTVPEWVLIKDGKFNLITFTVDLSSFEGPEDLQTVLIDKFKSVKKTSCNQSSHVNRRKKTQLFNELKHQTSPANKNGAYNQWTSSVKKAKNLIKKNYFEKIVLARKVTVSNNENLAPTEILNALRNQYANCYNFLVHHHGKTFLGSSPERLGTIRKHMLLTEALAGSMKRGQTASEDSMLSQNLSDSPKNRNEHNFVVKDIEERLNPFAQKLHRNQHPEIKKLTNVQHLYTPIRAELHPEATILEVIGELHPTPAVGGYPRKDASPYIKKLEQFDRGWYASPVGWLNSKGMGEFAVGIRSGLIDKKEAHFFAGCGIVADSDPAAEWEETNLKLKPMLSALQYD